MNPQKRKTFLECMFNDLDNIHEGTDEEVREELISMGIDIEKARKSYLAVIEKCKANSKDSDNGNKP